METIHLQWIATLGAYLRACFGWFHKDCRSAEDEAAAHLIKEVKQFPESFTLCHIALQDFQRRNVVHVPTLHCLGHVGYFHRTRSAGARDFVASPQCHIEHVLGRSIVGSPKLAKFLLSFGNAVAKGELMES